MFLDVLMTAWSHTHWGKIYSKLEKAYDEAGFKFVIDSAFCSANIPYLIKSTHDYLTANHNLLTHEVQLVDLGIKKDVTSTCQSSGWGMQEVQASFPCLTLLFEEYGERKMILTLLILLS